MKVHYKYLQNISFLGLGEIIVRGINFIATLALARILGVNAFAELSVVLALYSYFALFTSNGTEVIAIREASKFPNQVDQVLSSYFIIRIAYVVLSYVAFSFYILLLTPNRSLSFLLLLQLLNLLLFPISIQYVFQAKQNAFIVFLSRFIQSALYLILIVIVVHTPTDLYYVPVVSLASASFAQIILWIIFLQKEKLQICIFKEYIKYFLKSSLQIGIPSFFIMLHENADVVLLNYFGFTQDIGLYSAAYRVLFFIGGLQSILSQATIPYIIELLKKSSDKIYSILRKYLLLILIGVTIIIIPIASYSPEIMRILYGNSYSEGGIYLSILILSSVFIVANTFLVQWLIVRDRQNIYFRTILVISLINVLLNYIFIPFYGALASACITIATELLFFIVLIIIVWKEWSLNSRYLPLTIASTLVCLVTLLSHNLFFMLAIECGLIFFLIRLFAKTIADIKNIEVGSSCE